MALLMLFGFLAGAGTALSPCVLPVLPIALSAGATGGRRRPLGIVAGLAVSFTFATVALVYVISALGLPDDLLRKLAIAVLLAFGISLMIPPLAARIEATTSRFASRAGVAGGGGDGFWSGCARRRQPRPRLRPLRRPDPRRRDHRLGLAALHRRPPRGGAQLRDRLGRRPLLPDARRPSLGRAAGAAWHRSAGDDGSGDGRGRAGDGGRIRHPLPELDRQRLPSFLVNPTESLEDTAAARTALSDVRGESAHGVGAKATSGARGRSDSPRNSREAAWEGSRRPAYAALPVLGTAPEFVGNQHWFNTPGDEPLTLRSLRGRVVLVDFWTYTCINCLRTLPYLTAWDRTYRKDGLTIVGVHSPEFPFEKDAGNVADAIERNGIHYPVVQDNDLATWSAYGNQYWPAEYFVDSRGRVRFVHFGEGEYGEKERIIRELLAEAGRPVARHDAGAHGIVAAHGVTTPETYLGAARAERFTNPMLSPGARDFGALARAAAERIRLRRPLEDRARVGDRADGGIAGPPLRRPPRLPGARLAGASAPRPRPARRPPDPRRPRRLRRARRLGRRHRPAPLRASRPARSRTTCSRWSRKGA